MLKTSRIQKLLLRDYQFPRHSVSYVLHFCITNAFTEEHTLKRKALDKHEAVT